MVSEPNLIRPIVFAIVAISDGIIPFNITKDITPTIPVIDLNGFFIRSFLAALIFLSKITSLGLIISSCNSFASFSSNDSAEPLNSLSASLNAFLKDMKASFSRLRSFSISFIDISYTKGTIKDN